MHCTPSHPPQRQIFASASVDNTVRVYSTTHSAALLVVEPMGGMSVTSLHWSPLRPTVFGVGCGMLCVVCCDNMV